MEVNILQIPTWQRKIVIILANHIKLDLLTSDEGKAILSNKEAVVLSEDDIDTFKSNVTIMGVNSPAPGLIYALSAFDKNTYYEVSEYRNLVSMEKMAATVRLCQLLGAKKVSNEILKIYDKETNQEISADFKKPGVNGNLVVKIDELQQLKNRMKLEYNLSGSKANYNLALEYLKTRSLDADPNLKELVEISAGPGSSENPPRSLRQEICLSDAAQDAFNVAGGMKLGVISMKMEYGKIVKEKTEISITLAIEF